MNGKYFLLVLHYEKTWKKIKLEKLDISFAEPISKNEKGIPYANTTLCETTFFFYFNQIF